MLFCDDYPDDEGFYKKDYWVKSMEANAVREDLPNGSSYDRISNDAVELSFT